MRITIRLVLSLVLVAALVALLFSYFQVNGESRRLSEELDRRAVILSEDISESLRTFSWSDSPGILTGLAKRFSQRERLIGIAIYDKDGVLAASSSSVDVLLRPAFSMVLDAISSGRQMNVLERGGKKFVHYSIFPLNKENQNIGILVLFHDASFIRARLKQIWQNNFLRFLVLAILIMVTTVLVIRWNITGPIAQIAQWLKGLRLGKASRTEFLPRGDMLRPLVDEVSQLARSLAQAKARAEKEARLRIKGEALWTSERLKEYLRRELKEKSLCIVSNREPYMHIKKGRQIECLVPAGGLVTALDPVLRACGGIWIAHGSGDADRDMSDKHGKLSVPPEEPLYVLKRIWLGKEEEAGYYYGFANEGLWPLCHITHTRPIFRLDDWIHYQQVNKKFADAVLAEMESEENPLILIQDYHFALLPMLVKSKRPEARVAIFWHIPWPNPDVFEICPWKKEILLGLLGADLIGFHTQFHCNNFLETVDRVLESKINWGDFSVQRQGQITLVKPFPISVSFAEAEDMDQELGKRLTLRENIVKDNGIPAEYIGVGVDRIDYTKGIIERFKAIERFLEKYPEYVGRFVFFELGVPSRIHIPRYQELLSEVEALSESVNWRFRKKNWQPIVFLKAHHSHIVINRYYLAADFCMVTSLHDGMNLVAKEFVSSRRDADGVLVLSQFTGAARELRDALIVNPYDIEEMADAIHNALSMPADIRREHMRRMRETVRERNIYRWAANLITALSRIHIPQSVPAEKSDMS